MDFHVDNRVKTFFTTYSPQDLILHHDLFDDIKQTYTKPVASNNVSEWDIACWTKHCQEMSQAKQDHNAKSPFEIHKLVQQQLHHLKLSSLSSQYNDNTHPATPSMMTWLMPEDLVCWSYASPTTLLSTGWSFCRNNYGWLDINKTREKASLYTFFYSQAPSQVYFIPVLYCPTFGYLVVEPQSSQEISAIQQVVCIQRFVDFESLLQSLLDSLGLTWDNWDNMKLQET